MKKEKHNIKEETKEELRDFLPGKIRPEDLEIDDNVDDKYTSSVFARYKKGRQKNKWFLWSGYLSVAFGVLCIVTMLIVGIVFASRSGTLKHEQLLGRYDYDGTRTKIIISGIIVPLVGIASIFIGLKIKSYSALSQEELIDNVWSIAGMSVLQFFFGGLFFVVLTFAGYFVGIGSDYGAIYYSRIESNSLQQRKLKDAQRLYNNGIISMEEYQRLRNKILQDIDYEL